MDYRERRLTVPAVIEKVEDVCEFVSEVARSAGMDDEAVYHCYLAVEEICTNVIEHGYKYQGANDVIDVTCKLQPHMLTILIMDDAQQFNPLILTDPDPKAPLLERQSGGWGVFFVKKFMDRVDYRFEQNRNKLIMEKRF